MLSKIQSYWVVFFTAVFVVANSILVANEFYWLNILPIIIAIVLLAFLSLEYLLLIIAFFTPLSISLEGLDLGGIGMFVPTEPLLFGLLLLFILKLLSGEKLDKKLLSYPITYAIFFYLIWMGFTIITSEIPLVSFKFLLSRLWFIVAFYFLGTQLFKKQKNIRNLLWLYLLPLCFVILNTSFKHAQFHFDLESSHLVMYPFFKDHTRYGAVIAMLLPMAIYLLYTRKRRGVVIGLIAILVLGLVLSYTRAAWVSLLGAVAFAFVLKFRIRFRTFVSIAVVGVGVLLFSWSTIIMSLEKNSQDSSSTLSKHVESVSNISTDASNLERINRWNCAIRMFQERPIVGWGPGTYAFQYAPFQRAGEKTIISTNQGDLGNAHSEFLGPLAESGILGMLSFLILMLTVYYKGMQLYYHLPNGDLKNLIFFTLLSLTTYFVHGFLNNFLDTDKLAVPFWGFIAIIVAVDIYHKKEVS
ncbi:MAG: O-antigen ligase family protein [Flavobacteriales bacterium]|nr:O-antigen ligase family protein [Flavobacteriales bacterium]